MRAKIRTEKVTNGYKLVAILPDGETEDVEEGRVHASRQDAMTDARLIYPVNSVWEWRESDRSIKID
jgi:hypothetical protein